MICSKCGGQVIWVGPFSNLTHTECQNCGGINCQVPESRVCETCDGEGQVETGSFEAAHHIQTCPDCDGNGR